ncbi:Hypothetical_protein [Hexamita inflata]|uniref:Hypothetical_protein n=1 Tax=Hexamita inflata TaxID=28002 RepID=A0ABP1GSA4_9EUKA
MQVSNNLENNTSELEAPQLDIVVPDMLDLYTEQNMTENGKFFIYNQTQVKKAVKKDEVKQKKNMTEQEKQQIMKVLKVSKNIRDYQAIQNVQLPELTTKKWGKVMPKQVQKPKQQYQFTNESMNIAPEDFRITDIIINCQNNKLNMSEMDVKSDELAKKITELERDLSKFGTEMKTLKQQVTDDIRMGYFTAII